MRPPARRAVLCTVATLLLAACQRETANAPAPPGPAGNAAAVVRDAAPTAPGNTGAPAELAAAGWRVEQTVRGDLNRDGLEDAAVTLIEGDPARGGGKRALLVLLGQVGGGLQQIERLDRLLPCLSCLGTLGGTGPIDMAIEDGRLRLSWLRGSRDSVEAAIELGLGASGSGLVLLRDDVIRTDRVLGKESRQVRDFARGLAIADGKEAPLKSEAPRATTLRFEDY